MAQLPDNNVIALPQPGSARRPSSIDVGGYTRGAAAMASGTEALGKGVKSAANDVGVVLRKEREADDKLELARANGYLNTALLNHSNAIDRETNGDGLVETYATRINKAVDTAASSISNPRAREIFTVNAQDNAARIINAVKSKSFELLRDAGMANDIDTMNRLRASAAASGPEAANTFVDTIHGYIDAWETKGWIDRLKAVELKKSQAAEFARDKLATLAPADRLRSLHGGAASRYGALAEILPADVRQQMSVETERERGSVMESPQAD